jgi:hypothetical protein
VLEPNAVAIGLIAGLAVGLCALARRSRFGARIPGSFGQGFVGFRGDGWPQGVQEDDDARWSWQGMAAAASGGRASGALGAAVRTYPARDSRRAVPPTRPQR